MIEFIQQFHPVVQALLATCFTWFLTALGTSGVLFAKDINQKVLDAMLGFAAMMVLDVAFGSI
jgi:zinc transporter, ZIP family